MQLPNERGRLFSSVTVKYCVHDLFTHEYLLDVSLMDAMKNPKHVEVKSDIMYRK